MITPRSESREPWKLIGQFETTDWSGLDADYFIDRIKVPEVIQCNYQVFERLMPYWGYADRVPDRIYHGTRMIAGEITVNYTREGYLYALLDSIRSGQSIKSDNSGPKVTITSKPTKNSATQSSTKVSGGSSSSLVALATQLQDPKTAREFVKRIKQESLSDLDLIGTLDLAQITSSRSVFDTNRGFNLTIVFGADAKHTQTLRFNNTGQYTRDGAVTSVPQFPGDLDQAKRAPGTGIRILGVEIGTSAKSIGDDGRPLVETYTFQAKDIRYINLQ